MNIEIDQSGKVEQTSVSTVLADSLGNSILIRSVSKQLIQSYYREKEKPQLYVYEVFSVMLSLLIVKSYKKGAVYIIDKEYYGHENLIRGLALKYLQRQGIAIFKEQLQFALIGKQSKAHATAYARFTASQKHEDIRPGDIIFLIKKDQVS